MNIPRRAVTEQPCNCRMPVPHATVSRLVWPSSELSGPPSGSTTWATVTSSGLPPPSTWLAPSSHSSASQTPCASPSQSLTVAGGEHHSIVARSQFTSLLSLPRGCAALHAPAVHTLMSDLDKRFLADLDAVCHLASLRFCRLHKVVGRIPGDLVKILSCNLRGLCSMFQFSCS